MHRARRQPSLSHLCDLVLSPRQQRRPSIINPALSSQGSSHNMSSHVILTFFSSSLHRILCRQLITQICRFLRKDCCERESEGKGFDLLCFLHSVTLKGFGQQMILAKEGGKCVSHLLLFRVISVIYSLLVRRDWAILLKGNHYQHLLFSAKNNNKVYCFIFCFRLPIPL